MKLTISKLDLELLAFVVVPATTLAALLIAGFFAFIGAGVVEHAERVATEPVFLRVSAEEVRQRQIKGFVNELNAKLAKIK